MSIAKPRRIGGIIGSVPRTTSGVYGLTKLSEVNFPFAIGGDTYTYAQDGKYWRCHMFSQVGSDTLTFLRGGLVEYLVVGGGGSGSAGAGGGGGGAGGFSAGALNATGSCSVVVGSGGPGGDPDGQDGTESNFLNVQSAGGGGGGAPGRVGGSGGGGRLRNSAGGSATGVGLGNDGGDAGSGTPTSPQGGGGGGGADSSGGNGSSSAAGAGGAGLPSSISGQTVFYAGGGGGGGRTDSPVAAASGGVGGGGSGSQTNTAAENGTANTGGGGGGGGFSAQPGGSGGAGGSGIVIVRYQITQAEFEGDEPYYDNVSLLLHMNGANGSTTFTDSSKHRHAVTAHGNAQISTAQSKFGGASASFDGAGDYFTVGPHSELNFGTADFTVEGWINVPQLTNPYPGSGSASFIVIGSKVAANQDALRWQVFLRTDGALWFQTVSAGGTQYLAKTDSGAITTNTWHHFAATRSGGQLRVFVDGELGTVQSDNDGGLNVDVNYASNFFPYTNYETIFIGYLDDLRITKGAARYTANFTPPQRELLPDILAGITPSGLLDQYTGAAAAYSLRSLSDAYTGPVVTVRRSSDSAEADFTATEVIDGTLEAWCGAGDGLVKTLYDQSGHGRHASQSTATAQPKIVSGGVLVLENGLPAIEFDGTNDYLSIGTVGISGQQPRSFFWCANENDGVTYGQGSDASGANWELYSGALSRQLAVSLQNTNWSSSAYAQKVVSHFYTGGAITNASMYEDGGRLANTGTNGTATINTSDSNANIGYKSRGGAAYLDGTIQELIIYPVDQSANRIAIEDNINDHYNVFDPTVLLLHMDGTNGSTTFTDSSLNNFTVTANGDAAISTTQSKFGGASGAFDGSGDYLTVPSSSDLVFRTGDFTVEFWLRPNVQAACVVYDSRPLGANGDYLQFGLDSDNKVSIVVDSVDVLTSNSSCAVGQFTHVAIVKSSGTLKIFIDGLQSGSVANSTNFIGSGIASRIGSTVNNTFYLNGYIDDLRITKGRALYTADFTPPTQAHPDPVPADPYFNQVSLLLPMDGADGSNTFVDQSKNAFAVTPYGDASISTAESKFGGVSAAFDGTGDYLSVSSAGGPGDLGNGDFTIEMWSRLTSRINTAPCLISNYTSYVTGALGIFAGHGSSTTTKYQVAIAGTSFPSINSTASIAYGQWVHLALVRNGTTVTLYVDGVDSGQTSSGADLFGANGPVFIGSTGEGLSSTYINGYLSDLRITKGIARYTSNFTPPTAPHPHL